MLNINSISKRFCWTTLKNNYLNKKIIANVTNFLNQDKIVPLSAHQYWLYNRFTHVYVIEFLENGCVLNGIVTDDTLKIGANFEIDCVKGKNHILHMSYHFFMSYDTLIKNFIVNKDISSVEMLLGIYNRKSLLNEIMLIRNNIIDQLSQISFLQKEPKEKMVVLTIDDIGNTKLHVKSTNILFEKSTLKHTNSIWLYKQIIQSKVNGWKDTDWENINND